MNEVLHHYHEQKTVSLLTDPDDLVENFGWGWGQGCEIGPAPLSQQGAEQVPGRGGKNPSAGLDLLSDASRGWKETGKGQFSFQPQRKAMPKNAQTTTQLHSSHTLAK